MFYLPEEILPFVEKLKLDLGLTDEVKAIPISPEPWAEVCSCFENVARLVSENGGNAAYGWILHVEPFMITAEFHAVWEKDGIIRDITPDDDQRVNARLFIADNVKKYNGERIANVMVNLTGSRLIDDYIGLKNAAFDFMETGERKQISGRIQLNYESQIKWDILTFWSYNVLEFYHQGGDHYKVCFCGSELGYTKCHGLFVDTLCNEVRKFKEVT